MKAYYHFEMGWLTQVPTLSLLGKNDRVSRNLTGERLGGRLRVCFLDGVRTTCGSGWVDHRVNCC